MPTSKWMAVIYLAYQEKALCIRLCNTIYATRGFKAALEKFCVADSKSAIHVFSLGLAMHIYLMCLFPRNRTLGFLKHSLNIVQIRYSYFE